MMKNIRKVSVRDPVVTKIFREGKRQVEANPERKANYERKLNLFYSSFSYVNEVDLASLKLREEQLFWTSAVLLGVSFYLFVPANIYSFGLDHSLSEFAQVWYPYGEIKNTTTPFLFSSLGSTLSTLLLKRQTKKVDSAKFFQKIVRSSSHYDELAEALKE